MKTIIIIIVIIIIIIIIIINAIRLVRRVSSIPWTVIYNCRVFLTVKTTRPFTEIFILMPNWYSMNVFSWLDVQNAMKCVKVRLFTVKNLFILLKYIFEFIFNTAPQALKRRLSAAFLRENVCVFKCNIFNDYFTCCRNSAVAYSFAKSSSFILGWTLKLLLLLLLLFYHIFFLLVSVPFIPSAGLLLMSSGSVSVHVFVVFLCPFIRNIYN